MILSRKYRFAGTFDLLARVDKRLFLFDYKGTISIERAALQLAGYSIGIDEDGTLPNFTNGIGIEIREDGNYKMTAPIKLANYQREFLALRATYAVRERLNLNKKEED